MSKTKYIFVTGGVISSLGKGITAASIAMLLKQRGYSIGIQKLDPYLNVDPGTMSPYQHGEVYVTDDGAETDLDLGHYERFADITCNKQSNYTTGKVYSNVINREREGGYLGSTVQVIPHITDEIKRSIRELEKEGVDIAIVEIGGTAGDIESLPFLEAIRQFRHEVGEGNAIFIHLTLVPYIKASGEIKTKPAQQSAGILREIGIIPDILICRCERKMQEEHFKKLSLFCNIKEELVFAEEDVKHSIYEVPIELAKQKVDQQILRLLNLPINALDLTQWNKMLDRVLNPQKGTVEIAIVGKYISLKDAYKSIYEALIHGGIAENLKVEIRMVEAEDLQYGNDVELLKGVDGILVPGGFGTRGVEGKIKAVKFAREKKIPFFGICLGMHCAAIEFARNVCNIKDAHSAEFNPQSKNQIIHLMKGQKGVRNKGGTMRLGAYKTVLADNTIAKRAYGTNEIEERHRHRYEFNTKYIEEFKRHGMVISGISPDKELVEIIELRDHPWFLACQFHPEFKSRPLRAHPLFKSFIANALKYRKNNKNEN